MVSVFIKTKERDIPEYILVNNKPGILHTGQFYWPGTESWSLQTLAYPGMLCHC